jgi:hypothetical protein
MRAIIDRSQLVRGQVRIFLRRAQRRMAEHFLNRSEIGAFIEEMGGKRMA